MHASKFHYALRHSGFLELFQALEKMALSPGVVELCTLLDTMQIPRWALRIQLINSLSYPLMVAENRCGLWRLPLSNIELSLRPHAGLC